MDVLGVIAVVAAASALAAPQLDPQQLPSLPERGLVRETKAGVELQTMRGRVLGVIPRLNLAPDRAGSSNLLLRDRRGRLYALDLAGRRIQLVSGRPQRPLACRVTDTRAQVQLLACRRTIKTRTGGKLRVVARSPGRVGHWERAAFAPRGDAFFAQWSAECEVPIAFFVANGEMRPFGASTLADAPSSSALGWLPSGSAVVHFPDGPCGSSQGAPGVYAVPIRGMTTLLVRTPRFEHYWMWGG